MDSKSYNQAIDELMRCRKLSEERTRKRYRARGQRWENPDRAKNQSDC